MNVVLLTGVFSSWVILLCSSAEKRDKSLLKPIAVLSVCLRAETGGWRLRLANYCNGALFYNDEHIITLCTNTSYPPGRTHPCHAYWADASRCTKFFMRPEVRSNLNKISHAPRCTSLDVAWYYNKCGKNAICCKTSSTTYFSKRKHRFE